MVQHIEFQEKLSSDRPKNFSFEMRLSDNSSRERAYEQNSIYFDNKIYYVRHDMYVIRRDILTRGSEQIPV